MPEENQPKAPQASGGAYTGNEKIQSINVAEEIKASFLDYSMSVIISRALPDVDRKSTRLNSSHRRLSRMPSSA